MRNFVFFKYSIYLLFLFFHINQINAQTIKIHSDEMEMTRNIKINLPKSYDESSMKYPVVFLFDGDQYGGFTKSIYDYYSWDDYPNFILVNIDQDIRWEELQPNSKFQSFVLNELMPYVKNNYRTTDFNIAVGHSFGGSFVLDLLTKSDQIKAIVSISPVIYRKDYNLIDIYSDFLKKNDFDDKKIFLSFGENESEKFQKAIIKFKDSIEKVKNEKIHLTFNPFSDEVHSTSVFPGIRKGLESTFSQFEVPDQIWETIDKEKKIDNFHQYFSDLEKAYGAKIIPSEDDLNSLAYSIERYESIDEAINVLKKNMERFPLSYNVYDSLAEMYLKKGKENLAAFYYGKAIAIVLSTKEGPEINEYESQIEKEMNFDDTK